MYVQYGIVTMSMIDTNEVLREQILTSDDTDYQFTKWTLDINCLFSPASATVNYGGNFPDTQVAPQKQPGSTSLFGVGQGATGGALPNLTDRSIRHYLFQPRRQLTIWSDFTGQPPFLILQSPNPAAGSPPRGPCSPPDVSLPDELNGPFVEACDVVECKGVRAWWVRIRIVTYVNECAGQFSQNSLNPILTHRWKRYVDTDQDHFATLITEGEVVFRPSVMITSNSWPDQYRANFFPPIDPTFRREKIEVIPTSNGTTINYRVVDRELAFSIGKNCPATRIECFQTRGYSRGSMLSGILEGLADLADLRPGRAAGSLISSTTPKIYDHVIVKAWTNRQGSRFLLTQLAFGVAFQRIGPLVQNPLGMPITAFEIICTHEVTGKYVELLVTYRSGPEQFFVTLIEEAGGLQGLAGGAVSGAGTFGFNAQGNQQVPANQIPAAQPIDGQYIIDHIARRLVPEATVVTPGVNLLAPQGGSNNFPTGIVDPGGAKWAYPSWTPFPFPGQSDALPFGTYIQGNPVPPYSNDSRGTWRGKLVAQALANPCGCFMPPGPNNPVTSPYVPGSVQPVLASPPPPSTQSWQNTNVTTSVIIYDQNGNVVPPNPNPFPSDASGE